MNPDLELGVKMGGNSNFVVASGGGAPPTPANDFVDTEGTPNLFVDTEPSPNKFTDTAT